MSSNIYDVVIIGMDMASIITALELSKRKLKILFLEKSNGIKEQEHFITKNYTKTLELLSKYNHDIYLEELHYQYSIDRNVLDVISSRLSKIETKNEFENITLEDIINIDSTIFEKIKMIFNDISENDPKNIKFSDFKEYVESSISIYELFSKKFRINNMKKLYELLIDDLKRKDVRIRMDCGLINVTKERKRGRNGRKMTEMEEHYKVEIQNRMNIRGYVKPSENLFLAKYVVRCDEIEEPSLITVECKFNNMFWADRRKLEFSNFMMNYLNFFEIENCWNYTKDIHIPEESKGPMERIREKEIKENMIIGPMSIIYSDGDKLVGIIKGFEKRSEERIRDDVMKQISKIFKKEIDEMIFLNAKEKEIEYEEGSDYESEEEIPQEILELQKMLEDVNKIFNREKIKVRRRKKNRIKEMPYDFVKLGTLEKLNAILIDYREYKINGLKIGRIMEKESIMEDIFYCGPNRTDKFCGTIESSIYSGLEIAEKIMKCI